MGVSSLSVYNNFAGNACYNLDILWVTFSLFFKKILYEFFSLQRYGCRWSRLICCCNFLVTIFIFLCNIWATTCYTQQLLILSCKFHFCCWCQYFVNLNWSPSKFGLCISYIYICIDHSQLLPSFTLYSKVSSSFSL